MTRRELLATLAASTLFRSKAASPFPIHYAKPSPYENLLRFVDPGADEFASEKAALELEARLTQPNSRAYILPDNRARFEIKSPGKYTTGIWQLPDRKVIEETNVTSPKPYFRDVTSHVFGAVPSFRDQLI